VRRAGASKLGALLRRVNSRLHQQSSVDAGEPRRLVEMSELSDPTLRWGAELVRRAGSVEPSRLMQARVRERLDAASPPLRRRMRLVRWAPLAALLLAAGAGATIGRGWVQNLVEVPEEARNPDGSSGAGAPPSSARLPVVVPADVEPTPIAPSPSVERSPSVAVTPPPVSSDHPIQAPREPTARKASASTFAPKGASASNEAAPESAPAQVQDQGSQLMVDALQARRAKRYTEASKLAQQYLTKYPRGPLAEEALGLVMEAAANTGSGQRHALARKYLQRFPNGRFTATAQRILQAP
jgi:hypothetical protein